MKITIFFLSCLFFFVSWLWTMPASPAIPLSDPVYSFLQRIHLRHNFESTSFNTLPWSRNVTAAFLKSLNTRARNGEIQLLSVEKEELDYFLDRFRMELPNSGANIGPALYPPLYQYSDSLGYNRLVINLGLKDSIGHFSDNGTSYNTLLLYGGMRGVIQDKIAFFALAEVGNESSNRKRYPPHDYNPEHGYPYNIFRDSVASDKKSWDTFESGLFFESKTYGLSLSVDKMKWGPAQFSPLLLSGNWPPMGSLRAYANLSRFHYLQTINLIKGERFRDKFLFAHRVECQLPWNIQAAVNEAVVYGDRTPDGDTTRPEWSAFDERSLDAIYAIPFVPYFFAQHYNGDRDNTLLSFDLSVHPMDGLEFYSELLIDDLKSPASFFEKKWYNKWGLTLGSRYALPLLFADMIFSAEYSRIEPWVYTHFFGESHRFRHYGSPIGSFLGPNSDGLFLRLELMPHRRTSAALSFSQTRHGDGPGSRITDYHRDGIDSDNKQFLQGKITQTQWCGLELQQEWLKRFEVRLNYDQSISGNKNAIFSTTFDFFW
ncbi:MAG: hypothetical protein A2293_16040 [Elusimicrobia bacterium RIFOXYB2_FULL_49_7]|nr:MAG: hypothetical protein A2293_16040 [Elusimicrobia bacterium RIFOXYB2_FULL_49_7]